MNDRQKFFKQYINGEWCDAADQGTWNVVNPATEETVAVVPFGGRQDCRRAIEAAAAAFPAWSRESAYIRGGILKSAAELIRRGAEEFAVTTVCESGKPLAEAKGELMVAADLFEWFAEEGKRVYGRTIPSRRKDKRMMVLHQPLGVAGVITAWNFPAYNPARAWAAALAAGCTVVARPSEFTPLTAMWLAAVLNQAGIPRGVLNLVNGEPESMGQEMLDHPDLRKISFTGSPRVGKILMDGQSRTLTRLGLELGGNAPVLILPDVDVAVIAKNSVAGKFRNNGQVCVAPQRFLVHRSLHDEFSERVVEHARKLTVGSGLTPGVHVGPLINARQRQHVAALVEDARASGAELKLGGTIPAAQPKGYFYEPTVVAGVQSDQRMFREEIFGPVLPISAFDELDEAIAVANSTRYGLAAYVWTNNLTSAVHAYERLEFGLVGVNDFAPHATEAPFGGWKESGLGSECGAEGILEYMDRKLVSIGGI
jgi:acyl-CoA reductase-like NAD-dependent aldehyde dehydrogenase